MLALTIKNLLARKFRLLSTSLAITLGVAFVVGALGMGAALNKVFDDLFAGVYADVSVVVQGPEPAVDTFDTSGSRLPMDPEVLDRVRAVPGVNDVEGFIQINAQMVGADGKAVGGGGAPAVATSWTQTMNPYRITEGRAPQADGEFVADASTFKKAKAKVGDTYSVLAGPVPVQSKLVGVAKFGDLDTAGGSNFLFFTQSQMEALSPTGNKLHEINIAAADGVKDEVLRDRVREVVPNDFKVATGHEYAKEVSGEIKKALSFVTYVVLGFGGISLLVSAFIIYNTFTILFAQRMKETALLRAVGASRRQVLRSTVLESFIVGLLASVLGVAVGVGIAVGLMALLRAFVADFPSTGFVLTPTMVIVGLVSGIGLTMLSALVPSLRSSKTPPIAALRDVAAEKPQIPIVRILIGLLFVLLAAAAFYFGLTAETKHSEHFVALLGGAALALIAVLALGPVYVKPLSAVIGWPAAALRGVSGRLARQNAMRTPRRTAATASALIISVALVTFASIFLSSASTSALQGIDDSLGADYIVASSSQSFVGSIEPAVSEQLRAKKEVEGTTGLSFVPAEIAPNISPFVFGIKGSELSEMVKPTMVSGSLSDVVNRDIALAESVAKRNDLDLNSTVEAKFADGSKEQLRVAAVFKDHALLGPVLVDRDFASRFDPQAKDLQVLVNLKDGVSSEAGRQAVESVTDPYVTLVAQDRKEVKESFEQQTRAVLSMLVGMLGLAIIIALIGIANTLALSVLERTHELGLLRAVGMSRRQVRSMIRWESVIIALVGTATGAILGFGFAVAIVSALRDDGIGILSIPYSTLVIVLVVAVIAGLLAAILPARRAAKTNMLKAIATD